MTNYATNTISNNKETTCGRGKGNSNIPPLVTQQWFTDLLEMAIETPVWFSSSKLYLPDSKEKHPPGKKLTMVAELCSNLKVLQRPYRSLLQTYSRRHGDLLHIQNTKILQRNGKCFVSKGN